jgi:Cu/Zn superoxide dismutase
MFPEARAAVTLSTRRLIVALAVTLAACQSKDPVPEGGSIVGLVAWLRPVGSSAAGSARVIDRGDGVLLTVSVTNLMPGSYRLALHDRGRCNTPYARGVGPAWAPPGALRPPGTFLPQFVASDKSNTVLTERIPGVRVDGPDGLRGRTIVVHWGDSVDTAFPGQPNNRILCGVFEDDKPLLERD